MAGTPSAVNLTDRRELVEKAGRQEHHEDQSDRLLTAAIFTVASVCIIVALAMYGV